MSDSLVIVGGGVIGLSVALKAQERWPELPVRILAAHFSTDPQTIELVSRWAGAHTVPVVDDVLQKAFEEDSFKEFWALAKADPEAPIMIADQTQYYDELPRAELGGDLLQLYMPEIRQLDASELPEGCVAGFKHKTICIDTPNYLRWLTTRFEAAGGTFERRKIAHIREALPARVVINCTGLGARTLGGVEDDAMFPTRGQTVLVRAPWLKYCMGRGGFSSTEVTYIIPRKSGDVIVGGTTEANDWHGKPREETGRAIRERAIKLCPDLLPEDKRAAGRIEDLDVIVDGCGLRPSRKGGIRCERDVNDLDGLVPLLHAYGHGGGGFQSSLGTGNYVIRLLEKVL